MKAKPTLSQERHGVNIVSTSLFSIFFHKGTGPPDLSKLGQQVQFSENFRYQGS